MGNQLHYTKKDLSGDSQPLTTQLQEDIPSTKLYQHINELPLSRFIECLVDNNLKVLIISGVPEEDVLNEAWANIYEQYVEAIGDSENKMYLRLLKDIAKLDNKLKIIELIVKVLATPYRDNSAQELIMELNKLCNTNFKFNDPSELQRCINRSKSIKIQLELKMAQFKEMQNKMESHNKMPTREYFLSILITLSDYSKYEITDSITVYSFCERMKRFKHYCEQINK